MHVLVEKLCVYESFWIVCGVLVIIFACFGVAGSILQALECYHVNRDSGNKLGLALVCVLLAVGGGAIVYNADAIAESYQRQRDRERDPFYQLKKFPIETRPPAKLEFPPPEDLKKQESPPPDGGRCPGRLVDLARSRRAGRLAGANSGMDYRPKRGQDFVEATACIPAAL
jgi:hypothetical protein